MQKGVLTLNPAASWKRRLPGSIGSFHEAGLLELVCCILPWRGRSKVVQRMCNPCHEIELCAASYYDRNGLQAAA